MKNTTLMFTKNCQMGIWKKGTTALCDSIPNGCQTSTAQFSKGCADAANLTPLLFSLTVETNRPFDQAPLEIHSFLLSQVGPEIREKLFFYAIMMTQKLLDLILICLILYIQALLDNRAAQEVPYFLFLPGNIMPSRLQLSHFLFRAQWQFVFLTIRIVRALTTWPVFPGNPAAPVDPIEPWEMVKDMI